MVHLKKVYLLLVQGIHVLKCSTKANSYIITAHFYESKITGEILILSDFIHGYYGYSFGIDICAKPKYQNISYQRLSEFCCCSFASHFYQFVKTLDNAIRIAQF